MTRRRGVVGIAAALVLALGVAAGCAPDAGGPGPVAWDRVSCAECRMLVGDPRFAAQLRTAEGERRYFDDPGCLLLHLAGAAPAIDGAWVHHAHEDRWLALDETGFVALAPSPMGYGLGAVERGRTGAIDREGALARVRRASARGGRPE